MKKLFDLQIFADDADNGNNDNSQTDDSNKDTGTDTNTDSKPGKDKDDKKYSDKDIDRIINQKFAKWQKEQDKAVNEAKKLADMNAQQKAEYERDKLQKELDSYKKKDAIAAMSREARKMLSDENISIDDNLLSFMVSDDAEATKKAVNGFAKAFSEAVEKAVKERLKGESPRKGTGTQGTMTKEQIMAIKDPELRQQKMLENKHLFNF